MNSRLIYVSNIKNSCAPLLLLKKLDIYLELISFIVSHFAAFFFARLDFMSSFRVYMLAWYNCFLSSFHPPPPPAMLIAIRTKKIVGSRFVRFFFCFFDRSQNARFGNHFFYKFFVFFGSDNMYMFVGFRYNVNISYHH